MRLMFIDIIDYIYTSGDLSYNLLCKPLEKWDKIVENISEMSEM